MKHDATAPALGGNVPTGIDEIGRGEQELERLSQEAHHLTVFKIIEAARTSVHEVIAALNRLVNDHVKF